MEPRYLKVSHPGEFSSQQDTLMFDGLFIH
jgi:hypothetical protein